MIEPPLPVDDQARLAALRALDLLDSEQEERFDRLTRMAARLFDTPIALVSLVDEDRQWFKSRVGLAVTETPRAVSFCGYAVASDDLFVVGDASRDERFATNPLVTGEPHIRFYAGAPIREPGGHRVGTLCIIDRHARALGDEDAQLLRDLADLVEREIAGNELRHAYALATAHEHELAEAYEALQQTESRYEMVFRHSSDLISIVDKDGTWRSSSPAGTRLLGHPAGYDPEGGLTTLIHPDDLGAALVWFDGIATGTVGPDEPFTCRLRAADGDYRYFESTAVDLTDDPAVAGVLITSRDTTEREADQARLTAALRDAEAASQMKSDFMAVMSHEIRTPLNGVLGLTEALLDSELTDAQRGYAELVLRSGASLMALLTDLLDFAKLEVGKVELESVQFDLRAVVADVVDLAAAAAVSKQLTVATDISDRVPAVIEGDQFRIRQVLVNLVGNAVKFTDRGAVQIRVDLAPDARPDGLHIQITDSGIGMTQDEAAAAFDPFSQADASVTRRFGGTGLGLAIARELVELMGGSIGLESSPGAGSTFTIDLPFGPALAPRPSAPADGRARSGPARVAPVAAVVPADLLDVTGTAWADRRLPKLFQHVDDAIVVIDASGEMRSVTGRVRPLLGYPAGYLREHSLFELVAPDQVDRAWETMHRILNEPGQEQREEFTARAADGSWAEVEIVAVNLLDDPDVAGVLVTCRDVTVRRRQARELAAARDDALQRARFRTDFVASVSHELRTPLHALLGLTELLVNDDDLAPGTHELVTAAHEQGENLWRLVDDLLDLARIESGRLTLEHVPFDPVAVTTDVCRALERRAAGRDLAVRVHVELDAPAAVTGSDTDGDTDGPRPEAQLVLGDPVRFRQVITNLVGNAVKFTDRGTIDVSIRQAARLGSHLEVQVADPGIGMGPETLAQVFQPFNQGPAGIGRRYGGTGLGLAISRQLALLMGGTIEVVSTLGHGSVFTFTCAAPPSAAVAVAEGPAVLSGRGRVLVVEDSPTNRLLAVNQLQRLGYEAIVAESGADALELLASQPVDAVLMDWQMPDLDGLETTRRLRASEAGTDRHVPVIAVTASARAGDEEQCLQAGMDDFLPKPVLLADLSQSLHRWIPDRDLATAPRSATDADARAGRRTGAAPRTVAAAEPSPQPDAVDPALAPLVDQDVLAATIEDLGSRDLIDRLLEAFGEELPARRDQLVDAVRRDDADAARRGAHTLRGPAMMLGGARLVARCREIEQGSLPTDPAERAALADRLGELCDDTAGALLAARAPHPDPTPPIGSRP